MYQRISTLATPPYFGGFWKINEQFCQIFLDLIFKVKISGHPTSTAISEYAIEYGKINNSQLKKDVLKNVTIIQG